MADTRGAFADAARAREAVLAQRLATSVELDRSFEAIVRGAHQYNLQARVRLDALEAEIRQAAATWPAVDTPTGARQFQTCLVGKTREIHTIVSDAAADSAQRAAQVQAFTGRYQGIGDENRILGGHGIQLVDHHVPLTPGGPFPQDRDSDRPWEYNIDLKSGVLLAGPGNLNAGIGASIDDAWKELHRCFNCNFPIGGAPRDFPKVGDHIPLSVGMGSRGPNMPFPVEVTQVQKTADAINIEFKTLPGHVDGEGSTIHFRFYEDGGQLHLGIRGLIAHGPGAIEDFPRNITAPVERLGYTGIAYTTWQPYIDNLTRNIAAAKGIPLLNVRAMGAG